MTVLESLADKLIYLFIKGMVPSLLRLWFRPGAVRFAGSENIILSIVHVVETFVLNTEVRLILTQTQL